MDKMVLSDEKMSVRVPDYAEPAEDYRRVEEAILFLERNAHRQPTLKEIAESVHLSEYHFQRLFTRWVGISPKRFLQFLTKEGAKQLLDSSGNVLDVSYAVGLSGPGRLHDLFVATEAVTPGEYKRGGEGLEIAYGFHPSPFGECLLGVTGRGICHLAFVVGDREAALGELRRFWPEARLREDPELTGPLLGRIFGLEEASLDQDSLNKASSPLTLYLRGTNFQIKVWEALLRIPPGKVTTYAGIASALGMPSASRAVGNAVARNPIPLIIPCHRVIRKAGEFGKYRYGSARKKAMLAWEAVKVGSMVEEAYL
jgi:AraC family transcriptional regulator, regulatory protein of adaptative response / methylated-DNA-[protein]-cysteine methyltransferase